MKIIFLTILSVFLSIQAFAQNECVKGINELPLYGEVEKCPEQLEADSIFLNEVDIVFDNREKALRYHIDEGWKSFYQNDHETAIRRFNQAWLIDSLNAEIYWGLGNILGMQKKYRRSLKFFDKAIEYDSTNAKIWESASSSYGNIFFQTKEEKYLKKTIEYLKESVRLNPENGQAYAQLTGAYSYYFQLDSARKYLEITDQLDSTLISPELRKRLKPN